MAWRRISTPDGHVLEIIEPEIPVPGDDEVAYQYGRPGYWLDGRPVTREQAKAFADRYLPPRG